MNADVIDTTTSITQPSEHYDTMSNNTTETSIYDARISAAPNLLLSINRIRE
jgi:hypothetical protein